MMGPPDDEIGHSSRCQLSHLPDVDLVHSIMT